MTTFKATTEGTDTLGSSNRCRRSSQPLDPSVLATSRTAIVKLLRRVQRYGNTNINAQLSRCVGKWLSDYLIVVFVNDVPRTVGS